VALVNSARRRVLAAGLLAGVAGRAGAQLDIDVPFVVTPDHVTRAMLDLAGVKPGDFVIELGSGDGRIVITAARHYGARGLGVEIVPELVERSRRNATQAGVAERARFAEQDLFKTDLVDKSVAAARIAGVADRTEFRVQDLFATDLSQATVITMYLLPDVNMLLRPRLQALRPGTRIVSHDWDMGDWKPDRVVTVDVPDKVLGRDKRSRLYLWTIPPR
jgi:SAM-dependent methyltransferase